MKVCHVVATTQGAGWVFEQLRELRDHCGHEVAVVLNGPAGPLVERCRAAGIPVHVADFDFISSPDLLALPRKVLALARLFHRERFDVVQTHLFHSMVIGRIAAWIANVPIRLSMIAGPFHLEAYTPRWIDRVTCWMDTAIIASCQYTLKLYRDLGISPRRLALVYYGPDESKFDPAAFSRGAFRREHGWGSDVLLIGMVSIFYTEFGRNRWTPPVLHGRAGKGHEELIRAAAIVLHERPNAKFVLAGHGWHEGGQRFLERMQALVAELGLQTSVVFTGFRNDVPQIYRDLDISVQPSLNENLGGTIESLLMECPTVATRVGGLTDSVVDGVTGLLVSPADPEDLARAILRLLRDPRWAHELAKAGRERMLARFTLSKTVADLDALYLRLWRGGKRYGHLAFVWRLLVAGAFGCGLVSRFLMLDCGLLPRWDQGWRPWRARRWTWPRTLIYRGYAVVGRRAPSFGFRNKLASWRAMTMIRLRNRMYALRAAPRMCLYRGYAIFSRAASAGIGRTVVSWPRRAMTQLQNLAHLLRALPWLCRQCAYAAFRHAAASAGRMR